MGSNVDVLIRGTGPAGVVAASWLARAGRTVALVRRQVKTPLDRIEALGPDIVGLLRQIGLNKDWLQTVASPIPGTVSRWAGPWDDVQDYLMSPHGPAWSTRREDFDSSLLEYAIQQKRIRLVEKEVPAAAEFDAVGSNSSPVTEVINDKLIALTRSFENCPEGDRRLRIEAAPDGWWYALRSGGALGLGFVTDRLTLKERQPEDVWKVACVGPISKLAASAKCVGPLRCVPVRCFISKTDSNRIGAARVAFDPITGRGVVESMRNALDVVSQTGRNQEQAQAMLERRYAEYLKERHQLYKVGARRFGTGFWMRRLEKHSMHQSNG